MKKVGIVGGLGPETTAEFYLDIIFSCQAKAKISRPNVIIASVPMPYEIEKNMIVNNQGKELVLPFLIKEAKRLETAGADFIVMPCNSLHIFIDEIRKAVKIPVLSIIEETIKFIKKKKFNRVGIVSTSATIKNKLYENSFRQEKIDFVVPNEFQQAKMGKIILNLVTGRQNNPDREQFVRILDELATKNIDCIILACTDLQLLIPKNEAVPIFDTMKILADATVNKLLN